MLRSNDRTEVRPAPAAPSLPPGVQLLPLQVHRDSRGALAEFYRQDRVPEFHAAQWQVTTSRAATLRGMHLHLTHTDYVAVLEGRVSVGLHDLRAGSPAFGRGQLIELAGRDPAALLIPPGVAHAILSRSASTYVIGIDRAYDLADELGCRWDDPQLDIAWPIATPHLSARDAALPALRAIAPLVAPWRNRTST